MLSKLRNGCAGVSEYLFKIGCANSSFCMYCPKYQVEAVENFVMQCPKYSYARDMLKTDLQSLKVRLKHFLYQIFLDGTGLSPLKRRLILKALCHFLESSETL